MRLFDSKMVLEEPMGQVWSRIACTKHVITLIPCTKLVYLPFKFLLPKPDHLKPDYIITN